MDPKYRVDLPYEDDKSPHFDILKTRRTFAEGLRKASLLVPKKLSGTLRSLAGEMDRAESRSQVNRVLGSLYGFADEEEIELSFHLVGSPEMGDLSDIPLPPNIPRPEMWDVQAVVKAVKDGFTFMLPFIMGESLFSQNAYWILGVQYGASGFTVGPEHTPEIEVLPDGWIKAKTYFTPEMVPEKAWVGEPNENGVVAVYVEIDPDTIDWDLLNRGHQIRSPRVF